VTGLIASAAALLLVSASSGTAVADDPVARRDASTGYVTDLSPVQVAAVTTTTGETTIFARGSDGAIWHRAEVGGIWSGWDAVPGKGMTSAPAVVLSGQGFLLYARGADGSLMETGANFGPDGRPASWDKSFDPASTAPWKSIGGRLTSAPGVSQTGYSRTVVARGADGMTWQRTYDQFTNSWDAWVPLGGVAYSAPVPLFESSPTHRYQVSVVGSDGRVWQTYTTSLSGPDRQQSSWIPRPWPSAHGVGVTWRGNRVALTTVGTDHAVYLRNLASGAGVRLGGRVASTATVTNLPSGTGSDRVRVFATGADHAVWYIDYDFGTGSASGWTSLGGYIV
jgi:hypothetical protein